MPSGTTTTQKRDPKTDVDKKDVSGPGKSVLETKIDSEEKLEEEEEERADESPLVSGESENRSINPATDNENVNGKIASERKSEMEARKRYEDIARLAEERLLAGDKMFVFPPAVKPGTDVEVFLNKSLSSLRDEGEVLIMGAFNDWRWKSYTARLSRAEETKGDDWWSCRVHVPDEAYKMDFVFFNGQSVYDNNEERDFCVPVEGGMDAFAFEDFLLAEKLRELEKIAKEEAEKEREAEERRRIEAEKAAKEVDRARARKETAERRERLRVSIDRALKSDDNVWYIEPTEFKGNDSVRLYYNTKSGPLAQSEELWIHGGHNDWSVGLTIVEKLFKSELKGGDWWVAKGMAVHE